MFLIALGLASLAMGPAFAEDRPEAPGTPGVPKPAPAQSLDLYLAEITEASLFRRANVGLQVVDLRTGEEVFAHGADTSLNPASTMKVVTAATALRALGPSYRFTTDVYTDGALDASGVLKGNLYIKGHGDPTFVVEKLWKLVLDLDLEGIQRVEGHVFFDETYHEPGYALPGWRKREDLERGPSYFATLSALSLNFNTVSIVTGPGSETGQAARVRFETPAADAVQIVNEVRTGPAGSRRWLEVDREVTSESTIFTVEGSVPVDGDARSFRRTVADPTAHFMGAFGDMMTAQGITVTGRFKRGRTPTDADPVVSSVSPPLTSVLMDMNKHSNNFMAEQVLRTVGAEVLGEGTTAGGLKAVSEYLSSIGVDPSEYDLVNGSGLSREATLRPSVLTAVLLDMARDEAVGSEFASSLAIGGVDGTLWRRMRDDPGRLRGKTGTIDGVHCLAGYLDTDGGDRYAFAFMVNNYTTQTRNVRDLHDRFAREMFRLGGETDD